MVRKRVVGYGYLAVGGKPHYVVGVGGEGGIEPTADAVVGKRHIQRRVVTRQDGLILHVPVRRHLFVGSRSNLQTRCPVVVPGLVVEHLTQSRTRLGCRLVKAAVHMYTLVDLKRGIEHRSAR